MNRTMSCDSTPSWMRPVDDTVVTMPSVLYKSTASSQRLRASRSVPRLPSPSRPQSAVSLGTLRHSQLSRQPIRPVVGWDALRRNAENDAFAMAQAATMIAAKRALRVRRRGQ